jgi:hypothetical protein
VYYEARLVNKRLGQYKGYPLARNEWPTAFGDSPPEEVVQEDLGIVADHFDVSTVLVEYQIDNQILRRDRT